MNVFFSLKIFILNLQGCKFNYWETRGIPLRIEVGPREMTNRKLIFANRITGEKSSVDVTGCLGENSLIKVNSHYLAFLRSYDKMLFERSQQKLEGSIVTVLNYEEMIKMIPQKKMMATPFCATKECEIKFKEYLKELGEEYQSVKSLCIPLHQTQIDMSNPLPCFNKDCQKMCNKYTLFSHGY